MDYSHYEFRDATPEHTVRYLRRPIEQLAGPVGPGTRVLDVGCGNGYWAGQFLKRGCTTVGIDLSETGLKVARTTYPAGRFEMLGADQSILEKLGETPFDLVVSTEVVEHLYDPRSYAAGCFSALKPGGRFICSTPYHGYLKNVALASLNKFDSHHKPLWDGGHIKFWSRRTLSTLMKEAGFTRLQFRGAGRAPWLWMSMVISGDRPDDHRFTPGA